VLRAAGADQVFLTGPLQLRTGVTLVVDADTVLVGSRDPRVYDLTPGSCGVVNHKGHGCKPLILVDHASDSGIMGNGSIDGRGGATLLGQRVTWWDLAHQAKLRDLNQSVPWMMILRHADNFTLYNITLRNSPGFHVAVNNTNGFTAWGVKIMTPRTARNTDGIDPISSQNVTITHCWIHAGDDNVAVKANGSGPMSHISITHNHFFTGHGMSIGSETNGGVDHMLVSDLTIDGADNGIRIKSDRSRGGLVTDVLYQNVCMRNIAHPLVFSPSYTTRLGKLLPEYRAITLRDVTIDGSGRYTFNGLDAQHRLALTLDNVFAFNQQRSHWQAEHAFVTRGPRLGNLVPSGSDVQMNETPGATPGRALDCSSRFPDFPALPAAPQMASTVPSVDTTLYVAADGSGDYSSIQQALDAAPDTGALVQVAPGTYREILTVLKPNITLRGAGADPQATVVVEDHSAGANGGTTHSATVNILADNFFADNITFANDFNRTHSQQTEGSQAVALLVKGDRAIFHNVRMLGNQDTLYAGSRNCNPDGASCTTARQYFSDCYIEGNVDFIFGDGKAVFDHCQIHSTPHRGGFVTAQSRHYPGEDSGYVFNQCTLTGNAAETGDVYLGRPWRPYATVIFLHTWMGAYIDPAGWREWSPGKTHSLDTAYYAEFDSRGPGGSPKARDPHTHLMNAQQAEPFEPMRFLAGADNWNPRAILAAQSKNTTSDSQR
jgi:polygalacturonase